MDIIHRHSGKDKDDIVICKICECKCGICFISIVRLSGFYFSEIFCFRTLRIKLAMSGVTSP